MLGAAALTMAAAAVVLGGPSAHGEVTPAGVGIRSWVDAPKTLYQCPGTHCNPGQANPGNDLANACFFWDGRQYWNMVYNRANGHSGFIQESQLGRYSPRSSSNCRTIGVGGRTARSDARVILEQCPGNVLCNDGYADPNNDIAILCYVYDRPGDTYWIWSFNQNYLHEGFARHRELTWPGWPNPPYGAC